MVTVFETKKYEPKLHGSLVHITTLENIRDHAHHGF